MTKQLSATAQWMRDHPDDTPCPSMPVAAQAWRRKRGLDRASQQRAAAEREKYEAMMAEANNPDAAA